jgi:AcrR family transcriptional regulator
MASRQPVDRTRKLPSQDRAKATVEAILDATLHFFADPSLGPITTNSIAERAGVSIGTLYQYFPDKEAVVLAATQRQRRILANDIARKLARIRPGDIDTVIPEVIRTLIVVLGQAFTDPRWSMLLLTESLQSEDRTANIRLVADIIPERLGMNHGTNPEQAQTMAFVLSRLILGAIRAAALEEPALLRQQAFEDELVRLVQRYIAP